jgi:serine/threonine protein kinase
MPVFADGYEVLKHNAPGNLAMCRGVDAGHRFFITQHIFASTGASASNNEAALYAIARMRIAEHPHLTSVVDAVEQGPRLLLIHDPVPSGMLFKRVHNSIAHKLPAPEARLYFRQLAYTLHYCHLRGMTHAHLHPEALHLTGADTLRVFGVGALDLPAKSPVDDDAFVQFVTSSTHAYQHRYDFTPPEGPLDERSPRENRVAADLWALGAILFAMIRGHNYTPSNEEYDCSFQPSVALDDAEALMHALLVENPAGRLPLSQVLEHPWVTGTDEATRRRESQQLVSASSVRVPDYLVDALDAHMVSRFHATVANYVAAGEYRPSASVSLPIGLSPSLMIDSTTRPPAGAVVKKQEYVLRYEGSVAEPARVLEEKLGCHVFASPDAVSVMQTKKANEFSNGVSFEAVRMSPLGDVAQFTVHLTLDGASSTNSLKSNTALWELRFTPGHGSRGQIAGTLAELKRHLGGVVSVSSPHDQSGSTRESRRCSAW